MNVGTLMREYALGDREFSDAELSFADLARSKLSGINIRADLSHAKLSYGNLRGAFLVLANRDRANLSIDYYLFDENLIYLGEEL